MAWGKGGEEVRQALLGDLVVLRGVSYRMQKHITEELRHEEKKTELLARLDAARAEFDLIERTLSR